jgi:hypothetical protein
MYAKPGITILPDGRFIPAQAKLLVDNIPASSFETEIEAALDKLGPPRTWVTGLILYDLNKVASPRILPGDALQTALIVILLRILKFAGYLTEEIPLVQYRGDSILTIEEAVGNMLTAELPYPTSDDMQGDKATVMTLKTFIPQAIQRLAHVNNLRPTIYARLRNALGSIGYKIFMNQPITQDEKTFFMTCADTSKGKPGEKLAMSKDGKPTPIPAVESGDPLTAKYYDALKKSVEPGPGIWFKILSSNTSITQLLFYHGPIAKSLVTTVGYMFQRGPFLELNLKPLDQRVWTPDDQITGIRDVTRELGVALGAPTLTAPPQQPPQEGEGPAPQLPTRERIVKSEPLALRMNSPLKICGPEDLPCLPFSMDLPSVNLRLSDESDCAKFTWYYYSQTHQKTITNATGATEDDVYVDLAIHNPQLGEGITSELKLADLDLVMFDPSVEKRKVELSRQRIFEDILYIRGTGLEMQSVDMSEFYSQLGLVQFRPDYGEYLYAPRAWLMTPDNTAVDYIISRLGLSKHHALQSYPALTMSHNAAVIKRLTGREPIFKIRETLEALLNVKYTLRSEPTK